MIRINLLPFRAARTKENIRRQVSIFLLSLVLLVVVLSTVNGHLGNKVEALDEKLAGLKKEVKAYEKKAEQVEKFKKRLKELNKKIEIVHQLKAHRKEPPLLMAAITELVVPGRMQLTSMKMSNKSLKIDGVALDNETIAVFMKRLERSEKFTGVNLTSSKRKMIQNVEMKQFGVNCNVTELSPDEKSKDKA
ncbi:MAG: PilN domain-containing protein [Thermodesulfobacteriota bacterium]